MVAKANISPLDRNSQTRFYPAKSDLSSLPSEPGVYQMLDKQSQIIYVGKAKNLKKRVSSYFISKDSKDLKTILLVSNIEAIDIIVTQTEKQALILENKLIKEFKPKYNILLKDDKSYPYVKITNEAFPKILVVRNKLKDRAFYFGPYASIGSSKRLQRMLNDMFPVRDCNQAISLNKKEPKCINLDIGKCIGPCIYKSCKPDYDDLIDQLKQLLLGQNKALIKDLKKKMVSYSKALEYEKAAKVRDRIQKITDLIEQRMVHVDTDENIQVWVKANDGKTDYILIQTVVNGTVLFQRGVYDDVETEDDLIALVEQSFVSYFGDQSTIPDIILCDTHLYPYISNVISQAEEKITVPCLVPKRGEKRKILEMAEKNAKVALTRLKTKAMLKIAINQHDVEADFQNQFDLPSQPKRIFGFDISHLGGQDIVASAVCFQDGMPEKKSYRHFAMKLVKEKSNDPLSMYEAVRRRLGLCNDHDPLPNLILIDGGRAQLNFAEKALKELGLSETVGIVSLAKREEELYFPNSRTPVQLKRSDPILRLCQQIRDEAHRFAGRLQMKKRKKRVTNSVLLQIPGVGPKRVNDIYKIYGSLDVLRQVSSEELAKVGRMGQTLSEKIINAINSYYD